jgi:hypothetical protein
MTQADGKPRPAPEPEEAASQDATANADAQSSASTAEARAHLRLVTPETHPAPEPPASHGTLVAILAAASALMAIVGYVAVEQPAPVPITVRELVQLRDVYLERGIATFLEEKEAFRGRVRERLASGDGTTRNDARNVAALMFPDLLTDGDFEREFGMDNWTALQRAMENAPSGDPTRRRAFEDFRNMLWVYENGNRPRPELSQTTRAVLELYEVVSATR